MSASDEKQEKRPALKSKRTGQRKRWRFNAKTPNEGTAIPGEEAGIMSEGTGKTLM